MTAPIRTAPTTAGLGTGALDTRRGPSPAVAAAALASTAAFAAGCVLTQAVTVPHWRGMDPEAFLHTFATSGPATGAVLAPIEIVSVSLLGATAWSAVRHGRPGRLPWAAATLGMIGTVALFPAHFAGANAALLDPAFPPDAVAGALAAWNRWNWVRTGLAVAATVLGCRALASAGASRRVRSAGLPRPGADSLPLLDL